MPWLKITFDSTMPGTAKVLRAGRKRLVETVGRWVVFDKDYGYGPNGEPLHVLFDAATCEECHSYIDGQRTKETPATTKAVSRIEDDTAILPYVIADNIVGELQLYMSEFHPTLTPVSESAADEARAYLADHAQQIYEHNDNFRRTLRSRGNKGRDTLYTFMRHWLAGYAKDHWPQVFQVLPVTYLVGGELPQAPARNQAPRKFRDGKSASANDRED